MLAISAPWPWLISPLAHQMFAAAPSASPRKVAFHPPCTGPVGAGFKPALRSLFPTVPPRPCSPWIAFPRNEMESTTAICRPGFLVRKLLSHAIGRRFPPRGLEAMGDMSEILTIKPEWLSADHGPPEVRGTSAQLSIMIGDGVATRAEDDWSGSVHPWVRLSAYPLALWFAGSWWRLLSEPAPESTHRGLSWRMAHEAAAAGGGFLWPSLAFEPDGENVEIICRASSAASTEPVRYLSTFRKLVP